MLQKFPLPAEFSTDYDHKHLILYDFYVIKVKKGANPRSSCLYSDAKYIVNDSSYNTGS